MTPGRSPVRSRVRLAAAAVSAAILLVVGTAGLPSPAIAQESGGRVLVVSDSIVAGAERELTGALSEGGRSVVFDAQISRTAYAAPAAVAAHAPAPDDTVVLSLGVNDGATASAFRTRVDAVLVEVGEVARVYWVNLHEVREEYRVANAVLADAASRHPNLVVLDWNSVASERPDLTVGDGLHLTGAGAAAMTELIGRAVRSAAAPTTTAPTTVAPPPTTAPATTAAPDTAAPPASPPATALDADDGAGATEQRSQDATPTRRSSGSAWRSVVGWTVSGFAIVVGLLVLGGLVLAVWSLWSTRRARTPRPAPSQNHPAVRARVRAERIAAARATAQET